MKKFKFEGYCSSSYLLQSPHASASVSCTQRDGWEIVTVTKQQFVEFSERRRHGEDCTPMDCATVWIETPNGKKVKVDLRENQVFYL